MKNERLFLVGDDGNMTELPATLAELPEITAADDAEPAMPELVSLESLQLSFTLTDEQMAEVSKLAEYIAQQIAKTVDEMIGEICRVMGQFGKTLQEAVSQLDEYYAALSEVSDHRHHHTAKWKNRRCRAAVKLHYTPALPMLYLKQAWQCKRLARSDLCGII